MVHGSETCEPTEPHLLTQVHTTTAAVHEAMCMDDIEQALVEKDLPPREHLVDAASISAARLVTSRAAYGMTLRGPTRPSQGWQTQGEGAYPIDRFAVDWEQQEAHGPQGKHAVSWTEHVDQAGKPWGIVQCSRKDGRTCTERAACTRAQHKARSLPLPPREQDEAVQAARAWDASEEGKRQ
jgi:transposase